MSSFAPSGGPQGQAACYTEGQEFFPGIGRIQYKPEAEPKDVLCFKHYNPDEVVAGRSMADWLRFSVCYWHTFRGTGADPFGYPTLVRPWDDGTDSIDNAKRRLRAAFEFFSKLGVRFWSFHDRDIAPMADDPASTNANLDQLVELAAQLQEATGVQLLWATCNLFAHPLYACGASTSPQLPVFAMAAAQVKKGLEIAKKLGALGFVFWGGREGYQSLLNTHLRTELDNMAAFFKMVVAYKEKIGFTGQLLIEPKPKEPMKHQYDYDAQTVIAFLKTYDLDKHFKLNIEPNHTTLAGHGHEHDIAMASCYGMLGSIDANTGSPDLGWDTDQFPMDLKNATLVAKVVIEQGGLAPGGLNFDCKVRRESIALEDMFISHIGAMDTFAQALKNAAAIVEGGVMKEAVRERYLSFQAPGLGEKLKQGKASLEDCEEYTMAHGYPSPESGQQEKYEAVFNRYL